MICDCPCDFDCSSRELKKVTADCDTYSLFYIISSLFSTHGHTMKRIISWLYYPGITVLMVTVAVLVFCRVESSHLSGVSMAALNVSFFFIFFALWICSQRSKEEFCLFFLIGGAYLLCGVVSLCSGICSGFAAFSLLALYRLYLYENAAQKTRKISVSSNKQGIHYVLKHEENRVTGVIIAPPLEKQIDKHTIHIPFCPPFDSIPTVEFRQAISSELDIKHLFIASYGMRLEISVSDNIVHKKQSGQFRILFRAEIIHHT